jgi:membrane protease YdiL (CAAX protease family)
MEQHKDFPSFWFALLVLALLLGIQFILAITAYDLGYYTEAGDPKASGIITVLSCGIIFSLLMGYKKIIYKDLFNPSSNSLKSMLVILTPPLALSLAGAVFIASDIVNLTVLFFPMDDSEYLMFARLFGGGIVSMITACIIAPFVEEMLFRGIFLRSFLVNYSAPTAILLSALLFGLFHLNIYQFTVAFLLGMFFGWLYYRTQSLWPSIMAHAIYNTFVMTYMSSEEISVQNNTQLAVTFNSFGVMFTALMATILGILILMYIFNSKRTKEHE